VSPFRRDDPEAAVAAVAQVVEWPAVSVIVPVCNAAEYLEEGLESVVDQTVPPHEVVVVDDGSTDRSAEVAERFAASHPEVRVLRRENGGPGLARNAGIAAARGDVLVFHDADDVMLPERIALQVGYLTMHTHVGVVIGSTTLQLGSDVDPTSELVRREVATAERAQGVNIMVMAARASVFRTVGGFDPTYRLSEDVKWLTRAAAHGVDIVFVPSIVTRRRLHGGNLSHAVGDARREAFRALLEHIRALRGGWARDVQPP
jgi:glycosyltransferase involved in cell wall biosynthesis